MKNFVVLLLLLIPSLDSLADGIRKPVLVASIKPLALIANDLAGDWLTVETLLATNQEPHHVSLSIAQRKKILDADLVIWVSPELESFLVKLLGQMNRDKQLSFQQTLAPGVIGRHSHDLHYWLHPKLAADFYHALANKLSEAFPDKSGLIEQQLQKHLVTLAALSNHHLKKMRSYTDRSLIVDHQAYGYFADFFQLQIVGELVDESGVAVGPRTMAALAGKTDVNCIAVERFPPSRRAAKIAAILGVKLVEVDPLGRNVGDDEGYPGLLNSVAAGFERCFSQDD